jgi:hypothetical protein
MEDRTQDDLLRDELLPGMRGVWDFLTVVALASIGVVFWLGSMAP